MVVHSLMQQLEYSFSKEGKLDQIYRQYFSTMGGIKRIARENFNMKKQHNGVDSKIELCDGEHITVQEKWRTREYTGDLLIEYCSVYQSGVEVKTGWIDTINSHYMFVVYAPSQVVKIYPVAQLKRAWTLNKDVWKKKYRMPNVYNKGYITLCVAVPEDILQKSMWETTSMQYKLDLPNAGNL